MPTIDTSTIIGYADMTAEEKLAALESFEYNDGSAEIEKLRANVSKANSEAADYRKKLNARMTEEEKLKVERDEEAERQKEEAEKWRSEMTAQNEELQKKINALTQEANIAKYSAEFSKLGADAKIAAEMAESFCKADFTKFASGLATFLKAVKQSVEADVMRNTPQPDNGSTAKDGKSIGVQLAERMVAAATSSNGGNQRSFAERFGGKHL